jgi:hypothetical protein
MQLVYNPDRLHAPKLQICVMPLDQSLQPQSPVNRVMVVRSLLLDATTLRPLLAQILRHVVELLYSFLGTHLLTMTKRMKRLMKHILKLCEKVDYVYRPSRDRMGSRKAEVCGGGGMWKRTRMGMWMIYRMV